MLGIYLEPVSSMSKTVELCTQIRHQIERGGLKECMRLPPTRQLAQELGIARNVTIDAYEQLTSEGYLIGQAGSGTYVAKVIVATTSSEELSSMETSVCRESSYLLFYSHLFITRRRFFL